MTTAINIRAADPQGAEQSLRLLLDQVNNAAAKAVTTVTDWAAEEEADRVAVANDIPRAIIYQNKGKRGGPRVFVRLPKKTDRDPSGSVWLGAQPVKAEYLAGAVQTADGVQVGAHDLPGAFLVQMRSGHVGVFFRDTTLTRRSRGRPVHWSPNLPIVPAYIDIETEGPVRQVQALIPSQLDAALQEEFARLPGGADG